MRYNTKNPLGTDGSSDPRDLYDNAGNMDLGMNSEAHTFNDRLNKVRFTYKGFEVRAQNVINSLGFTRLAGYTFESGTKVTSNKHLLLWAIEDGGTGFYYYWSAEIPNGGKVVAPGSTPASSGGEGAGGWLVIDDLEERLGSAGDTPENIADKLKKVFSIWKYGALGTGGSVEQDTAALRAVIAEVESNGGGIIDCSGAPIAFAFRMGTIETGNIEIIGGKSAVIQYPDESMERVGSEYTVSSVFFCQRGSKNVKISGFRFQQHSSFDDLIPGFTATSFCAPIVAHRADFVEVDGCHFDCRMGRGVLWRGGNNGRLNGNNTFIGCGASVVVGNLLDRYYGDPTGDSSLTFSPLYFYYGSCHHYGHARSVNSAVSLISGADYFHVDKPKFHDIADPAKNGLYIYAGDFGVTDVNGVVQTEMNALIDTPEVYGTCREAIKILLDSAFATDVDANNFRIVRPIIRVTGLGLTVERFIGGKIIDADVESSSSPLVVGDSVTGSKIYGKFKCTNSGLAQRTISLGSTAELRKIDWDLDVDSPASDEFIINTASVAYGVDGGSVKLKGIFRSSQSSARIVQFTGLRGQINCHIDVDVQGAGLNGRTVASFSGASSYNLKLSGQVQSSNAAFTGGRGITAESSLVNLKANNCQLGPFDVTASGKVEIIGGDAITNTSGIPALKITNAANVDIDIGNAENTATGNFVLADFINCGVSNLRATRCHVANSTQPVIRASTAGRLNVDALQIENSGTGAPYAVTGTAKIYGDLTSDRTLGVPWNDANRLAATNFIAGTRLWNSSDSALNFSDGTIWRDAAGLAT